MEYGYGVLSPGLEGGELAGCGYGELASCAQAQYRYSRPYAPPAHAAAHAPAHSAPHCARALDSHRPPIFPPINLQREYDVFFVKCGVG